MAYIFNEREDEVPTLLKHRDHVLVEFPDERFEAVVFQWDSTRPTIVIQMKLDDSEPIQFPGLRPKQPGNSEMSKDRYPKLEYAVEGLVNPIKAATFMQPLYRADLIFSRRAFETVQPKPGYVIPMQSLIELRTAVLEALKLDDAPGFERVH